MTIRDFWRSASPAPRAAMVCATAAAVLNVSSYAGVGMRWAGGSFALLHLAIMALGFFLFARIAVHHRLAWRAGGWRPPATPLPRQLVWAAVASLGYMLVLFFGRLAAYGEGNPEVRDGREVWVAGDSVVRALAPGAVARFDAVALRGFSAAWLFFGLLIALIGHRFEERIRAYRAAAGRAAT
jgi:hypothetical protein